MDTNTQRKVIIEDLPNEMIVETANHLKYKYLCRLALTCKRFKELFSVGLFEFQGEFYEYLHEYMDELAFEAKVFDFKITPEMIEKAKSKIRKYKDFNNSKWASTNQENFLYINGIDQE